MLAHGSCRRTVFHPFALGCRFRQAARPLSTVREDTTSRYPLASSPLSFNDPRPRTNWQTLETQPLLKDTLDNLFANVIPAIRVPKLLSAEECRGLVSVIKTHKIGSYNENVYPPIGSVGITQFDHQKDKVGYFKRVADARSLHKRFVQEAKIDVVARVCSALQQATSLPVRVAREEDKEYFAGLLRLINSSALIHADYAPYDGPSWEIGRISAQITWNILLKQIQGGESIIYDRYWQGQADDAVFKKPPPSYGYSPSVIEGRNFKVLTPVEGDLTFFNSRNFHEVKSIDKPAEESRYTMSSFVGLLPESAAGGPALILWS